MQVLIGSIWVYTGESLRSRGKRYRVIDLLPAMKIPDWGWHPGVRYVPVEPEEGAPNDYTRTVNDFKNCFTVIEQNPDLGAVREAGRAVGLHGGEETI